MSETNRSSMSINHDYVLSLRVCVGTMCSLSILGSLLIIGTFVAYKDVRTIPRQLLVNLSVADLVTALSNLVGIAVDFGVHVTHGDSNSKSLENFCKAQAFFSQLGTNASIYWTIAVAAYMFMVVVANKGDLANRLLPVYYVLCWGLSVVVMAWFIAAGYLGWQRDTTPGWCDILSTVNGRTTGLPITLGYTLNAYLAFIILPVLYIWIRCHVKILVNNMYYIHYNTQWLYHTILALC